MNTKPLAELLYARTHRDFRGELPGGKYVLACRNDATVPVYVAKLSAVELLEMMFPDSGRTLAQLDGNGQLFAAVYHNVKAHNRISDPDMHREMCMVYANILEAADDYSTFILSAVFRSIKGHLTAEAQMQGESKPFTDTFAKLGQYQ